MAPRHYALVVIGVSAGGLEALRELLGALPADFALPILIVQHLLPGDAGTLPGCLQRCTPLRLKEGDEGERIVPGTVYFAPANYHLLVERDGTLALSIDPRVRFARPSVDVLFETAADAFGPEVVGVILTGANDDGSAGLARVKALGGIAIVQDPADAAVNQMPLSALQRVAADYVLPLQQLPETLLALAAADGCRDKPKEGP